MVDNKLKDNKRLDEILSATPTCNLVEPNTSAGKNLDTLVKSFENPPKGFFNRVRDRTAEIIAKAYDYVTNKQNWKEVGKYLTDKERLKALGVLAGSIVGVAVLRDQLPEITDYIRTHLPFLSKEFVSLSIDTLTNSILAPLGFYYSCKANDKEYTKKELLGQIAFAVGWGIIRHYVYSGLSNFDEPVNFKNAGLKTGLYTLYYATYGGLYAAFSEYWNKVCNGMSHSEAIKGTGENFRKKLKAIAKDPEIQLNLALNIANMFNPWVESRPTIAGGLLVQYNMGVLKKSHEREKGFFKYIFGKRYNKNKN